MYYRFGAKGDDVRKIQIALDLNPVDGIFGRMTEAAVKNYQVKLGLHPDGVITPEVLKKLLEDDYTTD
jgi:peptidoglycan L-alanyl-D-glutamate endopeptidase CwlK